MDDISMQTSGQLIGPGHSFRSITDKISGIVLTKATPKSWFAGFVLGFGLLILFLYAVNYLLVTGVGIWGNNGLCQW